MTLMQKRSSKILYEKLDKLISKSVSPLTGCSLRWCIHSGCHEGFCLSLGLPAKTHPCRQCALLSTSRESQSWRPQLSESSREWRFPCQVKGLDHQKSVPQLPNVIFCRIKRIYKIPKGLQFAKSMKAIEFKRIPVARSMEINEMEDQWTPLARSMEVNIN